MEIIRPKSKQPIPDHAKKVFSGILFDTYQWEQKLFDGTTATYEKLKRPDTVVVFPVLPDGRIILTEQEQPGMDPFVGATGGRVDPGEDIITAAKRELLEESGYQAEQFILWEGSQPMSKIEWAVYIFIAKGLTQVADLHLDAGEKIKLKIVTFDELLEVGTQSNFSEKEVVSQFFEAKLDPAKYQALKELFNPNV